MAKLHEVLAVEGELDGAVKAIVQEACHTFKAKPDHFQGSVKTYSPFNDEDPDKLAPEHKELVTTVGAKLEYVFEHIVRHLDVVLQKEASNQEAAADLVVDGVTMAKGLPATFLLGLEHKIKVWRAMILEVPTLAPGIAWEIDKTKGEGVYVTKFPTETRRTKKTIQHKILTEATKEHPAQIEKWTEDVPVGKFSIISWSGMLSPAEKSDMLARMDNLGRSVKQARQRANCVEVKAQAIGKVLAKYILGK